MNITETIDLDKPPLWRRLFLSLVIILVALLSFGIGRLTVREGKPVKIEYEEESLSQSISTPTNSKIEVVASKNGEKYHYLHCSGAKQISPKNLISFATALAAEASGYTLASNCTPSR